MSKAFETNNNKIVIVGGRANKIIVNLLKNNKFGNLMQGQILGLLKNLFL